jgi:hypothetical protein
VHLTRAQSEFLFRQHDDRTPFRSFIGQRAQLRRRCKIIGRNTRRGMKPDSHAIAERDRASLVEQQNVHVSRCFDGASAHCEHIALKHAIHSSDTNGAKQSADRRGNETHE